MACTVFHGRLHDTVTETSFGPQCRDDDEAAALLWHIRRTRAIDPRIADDLVIDAALNEVRSGRASLMLTHPDMLCVCGSGHVRTVMRWQDRKLFTKCNACDFTQVPEERRKAIEESH